MSNAKEVAWGVSALSHDAALAVFDGSKLVFASQSERYSRRKNDPELCAELVNAALEFGEPRQIIWHEQPMAKRARQLAAGQWHDAILGETPAEHLRRWLSRVPKIVCVPHHFSHAAAGYFTSEFHDASIIVIDAIGEWSTLSVWEASGTRLRLRFQQRYPDSLGLFYSAITQRCGLKPNEEEYILMGMAAYGDPTLHYDVMRRDLVDWTPGRPGIRLLRNLHRGCLGWRPEIDNVFHVAAAAQAIFEDATLHLTRCTRATLPSKNLVLAGGCVLNCLANTRIARTGDWEDIWIAPHPGDAGNAIGAVLAHRGAFVEWPGPYLGERIDGPYPVRRALELLKLGHVVGIANGRAEFGPRALGNRSLLADPRCGGAKALVNALKRREQFRPFAPAILARACDDYFDMPVRESPYMQFVARCKLPEAFPSIVHVDGSSRVQTVREDQHAGFHALLRAWYEHTGCPMLLNTSLNIKGEPLVNTRAHAREFERAYSVQVL